MWRSGTTDQLITALLTTILMTELETVPLPSARFHTLIQLLSVDEMLLTESKRFKLIVEDIALVESLKMLLKRSYSETS